MRVLVAADSGDVVGMTLITEAPWPGTGAETAAIPGSVRRVAASRVNAAVAAGVLVVPASCRGPLKPGPNPRRVVVLDAGVVERAAAEAGPTQVGLDGVQDGQQRRRRGAAVPGDVSVDGGQAGPGQAPQVRRNQVILARVEPVDGRLVLVNNAAAYADWTETATGAGLAASRAVMDTNLYGTWRMIQAFLPLLRRSEHPRIVNIASGAGSHGDEQYGLAARHGAAASYGISKAAVLALTATLAAELGDTP
jgi:NAD(P)-dependent dehydrogenase (short-subunit alcohol dehydrogenase family)